MPADIEALAAQATSILEGGAPSSPAPAEAGSGSAGGSSALPPPVPSETAPAQPPASSAAASESQVHEPPAGAQGQEQTPPEVTTPPGPDEAPSSWKPEEKALWADLPQQAREVILRREADFHKGYQAVKQNAETGQRFVAAMQPYMAEIAQYRLDPFQVTQNLWNTQKQLALGTPEVRLNILRQVAKDYNIDLSQLSGSAQDLPFVDEETVRLREQVNSLQTQLQSFQQQQVSEKQAAARKELDAFFANKSEYEFADQAADQMATLMTADQSLSLKDAYDKAIWLVPAIRDILMGRVQAKEKAEVEKRIQAEKLKAVEAVQVGHRQGSVTAPAGNLSAEQHAAEALRQIRAKERN